MKSTVGNGEYRNVPVAILTESPTNPRKRFDEKALEELAATFKTQGVLASNSTYSDIVGFVCSLAYKQQSASAILCIRTEAN